MLFLWRRGYNHSATLADCCCMSKVSVIKQDTTGANVIKTKFTFEANILNGNWQCLLPHKLRFEN